MVKLHFEYKNPLKWLGLGLLNQVYENVLLYVDDFNLCLDIIYETSLELSTSQ